MTGAPGAGCKVPPLRGAGGEEAVAWREVPGAARTKAPSALRGGAATGHGAGRGGPARGGEVGRSVQLGGAPLWPDGPALAGRGPDSAGQGPDSAGAAPLQPGRAPIQPGGTQCALFAPNPAFAQKVTLERKSAEK